MSSIERQPNGRWRARYRDINNRSRSRTFNHKRDAQRFLDEVGTQLRRGEWIDPRAGSIPVHEWAARWWATTAKLRPTTRRGYWGILHRQVLPHFGDRRLSDIDYIDVELFIADRLEAGLTPKYVRSCVSILSLILRSGMQANLIHSNPAAGHHIPLPARKLHEGDVLTMEQVHRVVECVPDRYRPAIWLLVLAGLRPAELCGLRVGDVNYDKRVIHVSQTVLPLHSFDTRGFSLVTGPTKTAAGDRRIPIPGWLCDDLSEMVAARARLQGRKPAASEPLFQTRYGNPLNRDKLREKIVRPALREAGLPETFRTYDFRHTHASLLIDLGANLLALAQRMGHSDPAVTLRVYGHLFEGTQVELSNRLDVHRAQTAGTAGCLSDGPLSRP